MDELGFEIQLNLSYQNAIDRIDSELKAEGFGILTRIDVKSTMKEKLDVDFRNYSILGACNPPLAYRALLADPQIGLLLPCNVTVEEITSEQSVVRIANPETMLNIGSLFDNKELEQVAHTAKEKLERVAAALKA